jgi:hypothetical protein
MLSLLISSVVIGVLLAPVLSLGILPTPWAAADGGDFSIDFVAAGPFTYNHTTGVGGMYDGRLISKTEGVNESLEGGDFNCGDRVVFFAAIQVDDNATEQQDIEIDFEFASEPTGQGTVGFDDLELAVLNVPDTGNIGLDGDEAATIVSETLVTTGKDHLDATIGITNLDAGERFILRLVTTLTCPDATSPTGNLQSNVDAARVVSPEADAISVGNQTVPMMSLADIFTAGITIIKDAVPNDAQDFAFTATGTGVSNFILDDDGTDADPNDPTTRSSSQSFPTLATTGNRIFTETTVPGWTLTNIACTGATASTVTIGAAGGFDPGDTSVTINLANLENVVCTFTNTRQGSITIVKDTVPNSSQDFAYTATGTGVANFDLDDDGTDANPLSDDRSFTGLLPGNRTFTETQVAGWDLSNIVCTGATASTLTFGGDAVFNPGDNSVAIDLAAGEDVTCTFTNTEQGSITIVKDTVPNSGQDFSYTATGAGVANFDLDDDGTDANPLSDDRSFTGLLPGIRTFTETQVAGWDLSNIVCTGATASTVLIGGDAAFNAGDTAVSVDLAPGEDVVCTFTNTEQGSITIIKDTVPNSGQDFSYTATGAGVANFDLDDDGTDANPLSNSRAFTGLAPGIRTFNEIPMAGWDLSNLVCNGATASTISIGDDADFDAGDTAVTIDLAPGEDVTCTFINTEQGSITIIKDVVPNGGQDFGFTATGTGVANFDLDDDGTDANPLSNDRPFTGLNPGLRTFAEVPVAGWTLSNIVCTGATASTVSIGGDEVFNAGETAIVVDLAPGEHVVCTFTNTEQGSISIVKDAVPNSGQDFSFTTAGAGIQNFLLDDDGTDANPLSNDESFTGLAPGLRTVTEVPVAGWTLSNVACAGATASTILIGNDAAFNAGDTAVSIDLAPGDDVTCTFTNTQNPPTYGGHDPGDVDPGDPYGQDPVDTTVVNPYVPAPTTTTPVDTNAGVAGDTNPLNPVSDQPQVLAGEAERPAPDTGGGLLPRTGAGLLGEGLLALLLVGAGLAMMRIGRRRRTQTSA